MTRSDNYRKPFFIAIGIHVVLFVFLFIHFASKNNQPALQQSNIIKAVAISQSQLQKISSPPAPPAPTQQQEIAKLQAAQQAILHEQQVKQEQLKQQQIQQQKEQQEKIVQQKQVEQEKIKQQQIKDQQIKQQQQQQQQEEQRQKLIEQDIQQQVTTQVDTNKAKQQAQAKQKQLQAAKLAAQQMLQQEVTATDNAAQQAAANQGEIDKYKALILQAISAQWIVPPGAQDNEVAQLTVRLAPGGMVLSVTISQSSGDAALDRSARIAVLKASPLPVPTDPGLFERFRVLALTVKPQGISAGDQ